MYCHFKTIGVPDIIYNWKSDMGRVHKFCGLTERI